MWDTWKKNFDAWEKTTAGFWEEWVKSPLLLQPAGAFLSMMMQTKVASDKMASLWWASMGLPTKRDQERTLHAINELQSKLLDLEEQLQERESRS